MSSPTSYGSGMKQMQRDNFLSLSNMVPGKIVFLEAQEAECAKRVETLIPDRIRDVIPVNNDMDVSISIKRAMDGVVEPINMDFMTFVNALTPESCAGIWYDTTMACTSNLREDCLMAAKKLTPGGTLMINLCAGHVPGSSAEKQAEKILKIFRDMHCDGQPVFESYAASHCPGRSGRVNMAFGYARRTNVSLGARPFLSFFTTASSNSSISDGDNESTVAWSAQEDDLCGSSSPSPSLSPLLPTVSPTVTAKTAHVKDVSVGSIITFQNGQIGRIVSAALGGGFMVQQMDVPTETFMDLSSTRFWNATSEEEETYHHRCTGTSTKQTLAAEAKAEKRKRSLKTDGVVAVPSPYFKEKKAIRTAGGTRVGTWSNIIESPVFLHIDYCSLTDAQRNALEKGQRNDAEHPIRHCIWLVTRKRYSHYVICPVYSGGSDGIYRTGGEAHYTPDAEAIARQTIPGGVEEVQLMRRGHFPAKANKAKAPVENFLYCNDTVTLERMFPGKE